MWRRLRGRLSRRRHDAPLSTAPVTDSRERAGGPASNRVARAEQVHSLHTRLASMLVSSGDVIALRVSDHVADVTAVAGGQQCRLQVDLRDPDAELVLAAKLACFVERVHGAR